MTKVVLFNGVVGSGKDTCSNILYEYLWKPCERVAQESFKEPLYKMVSSIHGLDEEDFTRIASHRSTKDFPDLQFGGLTARELLIGVSEQLIKPFYGKGYFGELAVKRMKERDIPVFVFSDSGFEEELEVVSNYVGKENVILCRIRNRGTFSNDSRSFLSDQHAGTVLDYDNSGSLHELHDWVESVGDMILKELDIDATGR